MKTSKHTDSQIMAVLKQAESGVSITQVCREQGISQATFYKWRSKYSGMDLALMKRLKELEVENKKLKQMYAEECMTSQLRLEALQGKY